MSAAYGFCLGCQADVPMVPSRLCPQDGTVLLPPSWGRRTQRWAGTDWSPRIERPAGYVYRLPDLVAHKRGTNDRVLLACEHCRSDFEVVPSKSKPRYCSLACKRQAARARAAARKAGAA